MSENVPTALLQVMMMATEDLEKMIVDYPERSEGTIGLLLVLLELKRREIKDQQRAATYDD